MTFPVYQCKEWQCRYVFPNQMCCIRDKGHSGEHRAAVEEPVSVGAVDPQAASTGKLSTREKESQ
jgi:hypothetical protein